MIKAKNHSQCLKQVRRRCMFNLSNTFTINCNCTSPFMSFLLKSAIPIHQKSQINAQKMLCGDNTCRRKRFELRIECLIHHQYRYQYPSRSYHRLLDRRQYCCHSNHHQNHDVSLQPRLVRLSFGRRVNLHLAR